MYRSTPEIYPTKETARVWRVPVWAEFQVGQGIATRLMTEASKVTKPPILITLGQDYDFRFMLWGVAGMGPRLVEAGDA